MGRDDLSHGHPEIQQVLEKVIKKDPMHPGGNHYYIHTVEASGNPEKALHSAAEQKNLSRISFLQSWKHLFVIGNSVS